MWIFFTSVFFLPFFFSFSFCFCLFLKTTKWTDRPIWIYQQQKQAYFFGTLISEIQIHPNKHRTMQPWRSAFDLCNMLKPKMHYQRGSTDGKPDWLIESTSNQKWKSINQHKTSFSRNYRSPPLGIFAICFAGKYRLRRSSKRRVRHRRGRNASEQASKQANCFREIKHPHMGERRYRHRVIDCIPYRQERQIVHTLTTFNNLTRTVHESTDWSAHEFPKARKISWNSKLIIPLPAIAGKKEDYFFCFFFLI